MSKDSDLDVSLNSGESIHTSEVLSASTLDNEPGVEEEAKVESPARESHHDPELEEEVRLLRLELSQRD